MRSGFPDFGDDAPLPDRRDLRPGLPALLFRRNRNVSGNAQLHGREVQRADDGFFIAVRARVDCSSQMAPHEHAAPGDNLSARIHVAVHDDVALVAHGAPVAQRAQDHYPRHTRFFRVDWLGLKLFVIVRDQRGFQAEVARSSERRLALADHGPQRNITVGQDGTQAVKLVMTYRARTYVERQPRAFEEGPLLVNLL